MAQMRKTRSLGVSGGSCAWQASTGGDTGLVLIESAATAR